MVPFWHKERLIAISTLLLMVLSRLGGGGLSYMEGIILISTIVKLTVQKMVSFALTPHPPLIIQ